jgi:hypothetical protein
VDVAAINTAEDRGLFRQKTTRDELGIPFSDELDYLNSFVKKYISFYSLI